MDDVNSASPVQSPGPRLVSANKRDANQGNAQHSTGPQTAEGKAVSRRNAVTHGFLANEVVVDGAGGGESVEQFAALHQGLRTHFQPANLYEERLVERRRGCVALPEDAAMDKILRYGGEMERRRLKTVHELERVQRLRGGESVPPPIAVDVQGDSV